MSTRIPGATRRNRSAPIEIPGPSSIGSRGPMFTSLHTRSEYSFGYGTARVEQLTAKVDTLARRRKVAAKKGGRHGR